MTVHDKIKKYTEKLNKQGLLRRRNISQLQDNLVHFDCNDYLSLLNERCIAQVYEHGYKYYSSGSGASMVLSGYHRNHEAVEQAFSQLLKVDDCLLFSSGYAANLAVTSLLGSVQAHCIIDKCVHASIYDGLALSQVNYSRFVHNDLASLTKKLTIKKNNSVVITEGIFSMSGHKAPLTAMNQLIQDAHLPLIVDEAHSFGILGHQGAGAVIQHQLTQSEVPLRIIPLGKAFAAQGALVAGQCDWIEGLLQAGRSIIYSTALSPALSYGLLKTLDIVVTADDRRERLTQLITFFKSKTTDSLLTWSDSDTAIQQVHLGCPKQALYYAQELKRRGFACSAIRSPTVSTKSTGLRIVLNYSHTPEQISQLLDEIHTIYEHQSH
jgi:8-amino-7-oxononanoate synthase